ncbi:hypothetical protein HY483_03780 [Candidatus Woesearchaeota archaeon]|nr:hypothetical protein [Candidatus Woesearchaeota archaeon]
MIRGRPVRSEIRENIRSILSSNGPCYGYEIFKIHDKDFFPCTREVIYYNLKKGVQLGIFRVSKKDVVKGDYSWGSNAVKTYYDLA